MNARRVTLAAVLIAAPWFAAACRGGAEREAATDGRAPGTSGTAGTSESAATAPATVPTESVSSTPRVPATSPTTGTPPATATMGRDSAFGPRFGVDSTGKLIPLTPTKKP